MKSFIILILAALVIVGLVKLNPPLKDPDNPIELNEDTMKQAVFAGGCFWCMEAAFEALEGVGQVVSGYTGGRVDDPSYQQVISGNTGHHEAVTVNYDSSIISYEDLVDYYWRNIDPFDGEGQFADKGSQYHTAIFYNDDNEKTIAEASKARLQEENPDSIIFTKILPREEFFEAEEYHQDYYKKNTGNYKLYELGSGRKTKLKQLWGEEEN